MCENRKDASIEVLIEVAQRCLGGCGPRPSDGDGDAQCVDDDEGV